MATAARSASASEHARERGGRFSRRALGRTTAWCYGRRRRVLAGWVLAAAAVIGLARAVGAARRHLRRPSREPGRSSSPS